MYTVSMVSDLATSNSSCVASLLLPFRHLHSDAASVGISIVMELSECFSPGGAGFEAPTRKMRAAMPDDVPRASWITNAAAGGALVAGILTGDAEMLGKALDSDVIVEAARGPLIPGFFAVKAAAKAAGAYGCTISGAGPTCVAVVPDEATGEAVAGAMGEAFVANGLEVNISLVTKLDTRGAYSSGDPEAPKGVM